MGRSARRRGACRASQAAERDRELRFDDFRGRCRSAGYRAKPSVVPTDGDVMQRQRRPREVSIATDHRRVLGAGVFVPVAALWAVATLFVWVRAQPRALAPVAAAPIITRSASACQASCRRSRHSVPRRAVDATLPRTGARRRAAPRPG